MKRSFPERNNYAVGSQAPTGYVAKQEWASAQLKGGLRQTQCKTCGLWTFPQEECKCEQNHG